MESIEIDVWVFDIGVKALQPDPVLKVSEWADEFRILSQVASAEPGQWRTSRTPYLKDIMDALSPISPWEKVVFMKGSQIGGSETGLNWLGYIIDKTPGPALLVMPTVDMAKDNSKTRIDPMIDGCPTLKEKVQDPRSRDSGNTLLMKEFPGGFLGMTGANSPAALRSKPIRFLMMDEVDAFPGDVGGEGDPVNLAVTRTRTFTRRKILLVSTPTIAGRSRIEKAYEESNKMRYYVPCPHCGGYQVLVWKNVKWNPGRPDAAWYECEHCEGKIHNHEKEFMLPRGEWRPDEKDYRGKTIGFHLSSLYSPVGWFSWGEMATMFMEAKKNVELLKVFVNTVLGETWQDKGEAPEWERLIMRREDYEIGKVPDGGLILTAGADVQKDRIECEIVAWGRDKESWSIDYRVFPGDTADLNSDCWKSLDNLISETFEHENGAVLNIRCLAIDTGYNTNVVYSWCRRYPVGRVIAVDGRDSLAVMVGQPKAVDVNIDGRKHARALKLWPVGVSIIKGELYGWLKLPKPGPGESAPNGFCHFPNYAEEYFKQLCAEQMVTKELKGRTIFLWEKWYSRNEALDCRVYARAAAALLQIDKFNDGHWTALEQAIGAATKKRDDKPDRPPAGPQPQASSRYGRRVLSKGIKNF